MRNAPEPHYSFTIPSIHDDTTLDCRIYHPHIFDEAAKDSLEQSRWRKRGIVMAHPYAPMGGSYDDRVVGIVVDEMLKAGYVVGTFNFRGAHGSTHKGRTSWSGKPELEDYITFAACFIHYMSLISPFPTPDTIFTPDLSPARPPTRQRRGSLLSDLPLVILGGYSYGSLILKHLPPVLSILQRFSSPLAGSAADEVLMRAHKLSDQSNLGWINQAQETERDHRRKINEHKISLTMGGEETNPDKRRSSREVKRSLDVPRSLDLGHRLRSLSHRRRRHGSSTESLERTGFNIVIPEIRYLLISPLTPPISTLAAPALGQKLWSRSTETDTSSIGKFVSLAIYGDQDIFASAKKTRDWSDKLRVQYGPAFSSLEVTGAGHFWVEQGVEQQLRAALKGWVCEVPVEDAARVHHTS
ncbi:acid phosphatase [Stagonosporopsis vannaccii]|nr:acid phosphatase [Stagonosporopsis vannaccii]